MQKLTILFLAILMPSLVALAQDRQSPIEAMVHTERSFAQTSVEQGIRPAFMAFIADDGTLFRPRAVRGKEWMIAHPLPPSDKRPELNWWPTVAGMASAGDMGYTSGPWQFKSDVKDAKPSGFGHFITVWRKQADGTWRFAVDLGISHPELTEKETLTLPKHSSGKIKQADVAAETTRLLDFERQFSADAMKLGARKAFLARTTDDVRVYREGKIPFVGKASLNDALGEAPESWSWEPQAGGVSRSGDLGYSYGSYKLKASDGKTEAGNYLRIWKKQGGAWKVAIDVANPVPEPQNN
jgi:ketosteroid isomerase-like protein